MPGGSTKKTCPFCQNILFCAQKICAHCLKEQPKKLRLEKKLKRFDEKRGGWVSGRKKNHNIASIKDEAIVLLEKLHAIGFKPVLLLGKETRKKDVKCEILTPRCTLTAYAQDYLDKIGTFYEYLCEENNWQEAGTTESQVPETSTVEVLKTPPPCTIIEVGQEEQPQRDDMRRATTKEGPAVRTGSVRDTVLGPRGKKKKSDCSYHIRLETFPIRSIIKERMRKGKAEMLVEWEPCPVCGKEWAHSWHPKNSPG
ncbi:hypothetical protein KUCAC02_017263 [Chaenocephalus aceratus]|uniref:Uncharacterized protein n=1 Tax=Chaenocephalus aceratus TaxID=36190 RepID=A0ACB9W0P3_CHAAC|nr:hypothetical protein KUCAC02_017263 [Chaenocephalus aceratus]